MATPRKAGREKRGEGRSPPVAYPRQAGRKGSKEEKGRKIPSLG